MEMMHELSLQNATKRGAQIRVKMLILVPWSTMEYYGYRGGFRRLRNCGREAPWAATPAPLALRFALIDAANHSARPLALGVP